MQENSSSFLIIDEDDVFNEFGMKFFMKNIKLAECVSYIVLYDMRENNKYFQLIDMDGDFDELEMSDFLKSTKFSKWGSTYMVVSILGTQYCDEKTNYLEDIIISSRMQKLQSNLFQLVQHVYRSLLKRIKSRIIRNFTSTFDKGVESGDVFAVAANACWQSSMLKFDKGLKGITIELADWNTSLAPKKIQQDVDAYAILFRTKKLKDRMNLYQSLKLLSVLAAIRLDEDTDNMESTLIHSLLGVPDSSSSNWSIQLSNQLASSSWVNIQHQISHLLYRFQDLISK